MRQTGPTGGITMIVVARLRHGGRVRPQEDLMPSPRLRWYLIGTWVALAAIAFLSVGSWTDRSWWLLFVSATIPPTMMLWFWNEDQPLLMGTIRMRRNIQPSSRSATRGTPRANGRSSTRDRPE
jgi:hypothetical protein